MLYLVWNTNCYGHVGSSFRTASTINLVLMMFLSFLSVQEFRDFRREQGTQWPRYVSLLVTSCNFL